MKTLRKLFENPLLLTVILLAGIVSFLAGDQIALAIEIAKYDDDLWVAFGTGDDFQLDYDSGTGLLTIKDGAGNVLWTLEDAGTTGNMIATGSITGASVGTAGALTGDSLSIGGGFGDTGITGTTAGVLQVDGAGTFGSTLNVGGTTTVNSGAVSILTVGQGDTYLGRLQLLGHSTASSGAIELYAGASGDTDNDFWQFKVAPDTTGDWVLLDDGNQVAIRVDAVTLAMILFDDLTALGGTGTFGVDTTVRGVVHTTEDSTGNTNPGTWQAGSADSTDAFYFPGNDGGLRHHTSLPTADTDGHRIARIPAFSGIWFHVSTTDAVVTVIGAQDTWTKVTQFAGTGGNVSKQDTSSNITGSTANSELTVGANGGGDLRMSGELSIAAAFANKQIWSAIGKEFGTGLAIASSTDATPVVVTTTPDHDLETGDSVRMSGHADNVVVNDDHLIEVTGAKTFEIHAFDGTDRVGSGAGAGSGGTIDIEWHGEHIKHRNVTTSFGDIPIAGIQDAVATDQLSLWLLNRTDANNVSVSAVAFRAERKVGE